MNYIKGKTYVEHPVFSDLRALLNYCVSQYGNNDAYIYRLQAKGACVHKTYQNLQDDIQALGTGFLQLGLVKLPPDYAVKSPASPVNKPADYGSAGSTVSLDEQRHRIGVIGENSYQWIVQHNATLFGLGVSVPLDKQLSLNELKVLLQRAAVDILAFDAKHYDLVKSVIAEVDSLKTLIVLDDCDLAHTLQQEDRRFLAFSDILQAGYAAIAAGDHRFAQIALDPDAPASLIFTSGTSSQSKGVLLSHRNIAFNSGQAARLLKIPVGSRALSLLPLHHTFENTCGMYGFWNYGIAIHINDNLRYAAYNLKDWQIQIILCVPAIVEALYKQIWRGIVKQKKQRQIEIARMASNSMLKLGMDNRRVIFKQIIEQLGDLHWMVVGAAALDPAISNFFNDIGIELWTGYGLTEAAPLISCNNQNINMLGSVGLVCADLELQILSDEKPSYYENKGDNSGLNKFNFLRFLYPANEPLKGEICVRGKNVMLGYFDNAEETAQTIDAEGWLHTGDVGYLNDQGCLYITGRIKSMIVLTNGKKVFPEEIEAKLCHIPGIKNALCWGEGNSREQIDIVAKLQLNPETLPSSCLEGELDPTLKLNLTAVKEYLLAEISKLNEQLAVYKYIRYIVFTLDDFLMTTTLKIKRAKEIERTHASLEGLNSTLKELNGSYLPTAVDDTQA